MRFHATVLVLVVVGAPLVWLGPLPLAPTAPNPSASASALSSAATSDSPLTVAAAAELAPRIFVPIVARGATIGGSRALSPDNVAGLRTLDTWGSGNARATRWGPEGRQIAIIGSTGLTAFDALTGEQRFQHHGFIVDARYRADGTRLLMLRADLGGTYSIDFVEAAQGAITHSLPVRDTFDDVIASYVAPAAGVAVIHRDQPPSVDLYSLDDGTRAGRIPLPSGPADTVLASSGLWIAVVGHDGNARVYGLPGGELRYSRSIAPARGQPILSADGTLLALVSNTVSDLGVRIWSLVDDSPALRFEATDPVNGAAFSPDGARIALGGVHFSSGVWNPYSVVWSIVDRQVIARWSADVAAVRDGVGSDAQHLSFSPAGDEIAVASNGEGEVSIWAPDRADTRTIGGFAGPVRSLRIDDSGAILAPTERDASVRLRLAQGRLERRRALGRPGAGLLQGSPFVSPDGRLLFTTSLTEPIQVRRIEDGAVVSTIAPPQGSMPIAAAWSPDSTTILLSLTSPAAGATLAFHRASDGTRTRSLPLGFEAKRLRYAPDGRTVATVQGAAFWETVGSGVEVVDVPSGRSSILLGNGAPDPRPVSVGGIAFTDDGRALVAAIEEEPPGGKTSIVTWQVDTGQRVSQFAVAPLEFRTVLHSIAVSPDGQLVAGVGLFGPAYLWSALSGRLLHTTEMPLGTLASPGLVFDRAGRHLLWSDRLGAVRVLGLPW